MRSWRCIPDVIKVTNLPEFDAEVQLWFSRLEEAAAEAAVGLAQEAFETILDHSPQYSGDFVANWKVGTTVTDEFQEGALGGTTVYGKGSSPAKLYASSRASWPNITLGQSVYLFNNAHHDEPYAWKIENGEIAFRDVNQGADHPVRYAALSVGFKYTTIGPVQFDFLRKIGK